MSSLGVRLPEGVHCHPALAMSSVSLLPVVNVVRSVTAWGPSLTQWASNPPVGSGCVTPLESKSAPQSVGKVPEESLTMFPSSSKTPALPTSVRANALVKNGTANASVISPITIIACMYRLESIHFVLYEISPIVDNSFSLFTGRYNFKTACKHLHAQSAKCYELHVFAGFKRWRPSSSVPSIPCSRPWTLRLKSHTDTRSDDSMGNKKKQKRGGEAWNARLFSRCGFVW